jgi:C1A family cysteine protease
MRCNDRMPRRFALLCIFAGLVLSPVLAAADVEADGEMDALQSEIDASGASWTAKRNWTTDLSAEEARALLGFKVPPEVQRRFDALDPADFPVARDLPDTFSWRSQGIMTPVKNQSSCGSCWDFAGVGALEAVLMQHESVEYDLSEQQVLSCATPNFGCDGGFYSWVWTYFRDFGAVDESCMPYEADDSVPCDDASCTKLATANEWIDIPNSVNVIKTALLDAPCAVGFDVYTDFYSYGSGCYEYVSGVYEGGHAVVLVGWDDNKCGPGDGAWLCKNSWGEAWGDYGGYFWIKYGAAAIGRNVQQVFYHPGNEVAYNDHRIDDTARDGDGWADPGESVELSVALKNEVVAPDRTSIAASLSADSQYVTITQGSASYGSLDAGETGWGSVPYEFTVDQFAPPGEVVDFVLSITADAGYANADTFEVVLGATPVLLIDDDGGESTQTYFEDALENLGYVYQKWTENTRGDASLADIERYTVVIWDCGWSGQLGTANRDTLAAFLDGGGRLLISGEDIGWSLNYQGDPAKIQFYRDYLHADYVADDSGYRSLTGASGDPIGDGLAFTLNGEDSAMNQFYPSEINPRSGATGVFLYSAGREGALRYDGGHREVYLAFGLEGVTGSAMRDTIMHRAVEWLGSGSWPDTEQPTVSLTTPNGGQYWTTDEEYEIEWSASDNVGVTSIDILRSWDGGATYPDTVATGEANDGSYTWTIPEGMNETSKIRVIGRDAAGLAQFDDSDDDFSTGPGTGNPEEPVVRRFSLEQNVPNPFNPVTEISYSIPEASSVRLTIFDVNGRAIRHLVDRVLIADEYVAVWDGTTDGGETVASGVYFYRLMADERELERRMILLK